MYGVTFGKKHSLNDYHMILTGYDTGNPAPKRYLISVPGRNGTLDMTENLTPDIRYENRQLSFSFTWRSSEKTYEEELRKITNDLHGKRLQIILDSDPDYYYDGFVEITSHSFTGRERADLTVTADAAPFKYKTAETVNTISGSGTLVCVNDRLNVIPTITVTASTGITFGTLTTNLSKGTYTIPDIVFKEGNNELTVSGTGKTTVKYRQGRL